MKAANGFKVCSACREDLPVAAFNRNRGTHDGLNNQCGPCSRESRRRSQAKDPERHRARHVKHRYGLSFEEYQAMVREADGKCAACGDQPAALEIDHCHTSGIVRGLICKMCNIALGAVQDDPIRLQNLIRYLAERGAPAADE